MARPLLIAPSILASDVAWAGTWRLISEGAPSD
jgi:hypothetical protein